MEQASTSSGMISTKTALTSENCADSHQNTDTSVMRDTLGKEAQEIIEEINAKRRQDTQLLADFRSSQEKHVSTLSMPCPSWKQKLRQNFPFFFLKYRNQITNS